MLAMTGSLGIYTALISALALTFKGFESMRRPEKEPRRRLLVPAAGLLIGAILAMTSLEVSLLSDDFSIEYLARNHSRATPFPFDVATAWAALEGSIVLWGLLLAVFTWLTYRGVRSNDGLGAGAVAVLGAVSIFFFGLMASVANPFETINPIPLDGPGPNPLLQNHLMMAIHPPLLYLGFTGLTVPFAFAISSLLTATPGRAWLERSRRATLTAWGFLTAGIVVGGWWSYEVLGWGGFWAWDPVENASFMPWLLTTALVHSALVQRRRGMLALWNYSLVIAAFAFTILGTFITRSGIIGSVHSFSQSAVGPLLLAFLALITGGSAWMLYARAGKVATPSRLDSLLSREGIILANNLLLVALTISVLVGTLYPILLEAITGDRVSVGRPFFDRFAIPLSYGLLAAMAIGPLTPWRAVRRSILWQRARPGAHGALGAGLVAVALGNRNAHVVATLMLAAFVVVSTASKLRTDARAKDRNLLQAARSDPGSWGGQVSHIGVVLVAVVVSLYGNLGTKDTVDIGLGSTVELRGYELTFVNSFSRSEPNRDVIGARIQLTDRSGSTEILEPRVNQYENFRQGIGTPAVRTAVSEDVYLSLASISPDSVSLDVSILPVMWLLWLGGFTVVAGAAWALLPRLRSGDPGRAGVLRVEAQV